MATGRAKRAVSSGVDQRARKEPERFGAGSITNVQMAAFQQFLRRWIAENCTAPDGEQESQRTIADRLGVTQNEISAWMNDRARPGLPRFIHLHAATGATIEEMLGLK
jgi:hypothetical protein